MKDRPIQTKCPDCAAPIGSPHVPGCDVERCPMCGGQIISCDYIYEFCGIDTFTLKEEHHDIWSNGPTEEMYAKWDQAWDAKRLPWTGEWPGESAARGFGWYAKFVSGSGWIACSADNPDATPDLNRLYTHARWNSDEQKWVSNR